MADDVAQLIEQLKALPLIESADLEQPFAAYDAFELVLTAIVRAALITAPSDKRKGHNRELFEAFVVERFPEGRGRGDAAFAKDLWELRNAFVKEKRTDTFRLTHGQPVAHLAPAGAERRMLNLETLIADFRAAVDNLAETLRSSPELRARAADELALRTVNVAPILFRGQGARSASATNDRDEN